MNFILVIIIVLLGVLIEGVWEHGFSYFYEWWNFLKLLGLFFFSSIMIAIFGGGDG